MTDEPERKQTCRQAPITLAPKQDGQKGQREERHVEKLPNRLLPIPIVDSALGLSLWPEESKNRIGRQSYQQSKEQQRQTQARVPLQNRQKRPRGQKQRGKIEETLQGG